MEQSKDKATSEGMDMLEEAANQVEQLREALVERAADVENLHTLALEQEKAFQSEVAALKQEIEDLKAAVEESTKARAEAEAELKRIHDEALLKERISTLSQGGLLRSEEGSRIKQFDKIRTMSDEDFQSYVEDLTDARTQALASVTNSEPTESISAKKEEVVVGSEDSASGEEKETLEEVLNSLVKPANAEAEKGNESSSKESASVKKPKADVQRMSKAFAAMMGGLKDSEK